MNAATISERRAIRRAEERLAAFNAGLKLAGIAFLLAFSIAGVAYIVCAIR